MIVMMVMIMMMMMVLSQMDPEEKERMEKRDWLAEKIQMLNTQMEGFEADLEKVVSDLGLGTCNFCCHFHSLPLC